MGSFPLDSKATSFTMTFNFDASTPEVCKKSSYFSYRVSGHETGFVEKTVGSVSYFSRDSYD